MPLKSILTTALELAGACLIGYGLWCIYQPAAFLFAGAALLVAGYAIEVGAMR